MSTDLYLFTGKTNVRTTYRGTPDRRSDSDPVAVTVLAIDQADAERVAGEILSIPANGGDRHQRFFAWTHVEPARDTREDPTR